MKGCNSLALGRFSTAVALAALLGASHVEAAGLSFAPPLEVVEVSGFAFGQEWDVRGCFTRRMCDVQAPRRYLHVGVDLRGTPGTNVLASATGTVVLADADIGAGFGGALVLEHDLDLDPSTSADRVTTLYLHVDPARSVGEEVSQGDIVATVAFTTEPHLHFGFRRRAFDITDQSASMHGALPPLGTIGCRPCFGGPTPLPEFPDGWEDPLPLIQSTAHSVLLQRQSTQYLTIFDEDQNGLDISSDFTIEAWVKPTAPIPPGQEYVIVSKWSSVVAEKAYVFLYYHDGLQPNLRLSTAATATSDDFDDANLPYTLPTEQWTHVAAVFRAALGAADYFVNGENMGTLGGFGTTVNTSSAPFQVGTRQGLQATAFDGLIDEVRVWNVARTPQEIAATFDEAIQTPTPGLVGTWNLDCQFSDASGNSNHLLPVNGVSFASDVPFGNPGPGCN